MTDVDRIARIVLNSPDVARLAAFYVDALGFTPVSDGREPVLDLGGTRLALRPVASHVESGVPGWSPWFQHCAIAVADMAAALEHLKRSPAWTPISTVGPETLPASAGGVTAFKFRDPDGHPLELLDLHDASGDGQPKRSSPFLRVDHTAISVVDVDRSVAFYASLGLQVTARSINRGIEQQRMDAVADPVVDVVTLRTRSGTSPHLELLRYRGAYDRPEAGLGRDAVASTRIVFATSRAATAAPRPGRDPDGHLVSFDADR